MHSATDAFPLGMCLEAGPVPHPSTDVPATIEPCVLPTPPRQRWTLNQYNNLEGSSDGTTLDGHCLVVTTPGAAGSPVVLRTGSGICSNVVTDDRNWSPDQNVGPGGAGPQFGQLVNFVEFGRCLDIPGHATWYPWMWAWPCKQDQTGTLAWNQKWDTAPVTSNSAGAAGPIVTHPPGLPAPLCLRSPLTGTPQSYPTLIACPSAPTAETTWTMFGNTGLYLTSYTIVDSRGHCLAAQDPETPGAVRDREDRISRIVVEPCDGSARQKWNADPTVLRPTPLTDFTED